MTVRTQQAPAKSREEVRQPATPGTPLVHSEPRVRKQTGVNTPIVFIIGVALIAVVGMLYLLQANHVATLGYEMTELQRERERASTENEELKAEIAALTTQREVRTTAEDALGMAPMSDYRFASVAYPDASNSVTEPAEPADSPSLFERFFNRVLGQGETSNSPAGEGVE